MGARAFMREEADILVLDEPTAALGVEAEHAIFERFRTLTRGRTAILISHRFPTVRMADRILVIDGGMIREQGSHEELLVKGGIYARLFSLQAEGYRDAALRAVVGHRGTDLATPGVPGSGARDLESYGATESRSRKARWIAHIPTGKTPTRATTINTPRLSPRCEAHQRPASQACAAATSACTSAWLACWVLIVTSAPPARKRFASRGSCSAGTSGSTLPAEIRTRFAASEPAAAG